MTPSVVFACALLNIRVCIGARVPPAVAVTAVEGGNSRLRVSVGRDPRLSGEELATVRLSTRGSRVASGVLTRVHAIFNKRQ